MTNLKWLIAALLAFPLCCLAQGEPTTDDDLPLDSLLAQCESLIDSRQYAEARACSEQAQALAREQSGEESGLYARSLFQLGMISLGEHQNVEAEALFQQAIAIQENAYGPSHPELAASLKRLGLLQMNQLGKYPEAEASLLRLIAVLKAAEREEDPEYVYALGSIGQLYAFMGNFEKAGDFYRESEMVTRKVYGTEHKAYAAALTALANLNTYTGKYNEAEPLHLEAMAIRERVLGKDHRDYSFSANDLGVLYLYTGRYEEGVELLSIAREIRERTMGKEHPAYLGTLDNLAAAYVETGYYDTAEQLFLEAKDIRKKIMGARHPNYANSLGNLANFYSRMGRFEKAEEYNLQAAEVYEQAVGKMHPEYISTLKSLATTYYYMGKNAEAEGYYTQARNLRREVEGEGHPLYADALQSLGIFYYNTQRFAEAEALFQQALAIREEALGPDNPDYAKNLVNLAILYTQAGRLAEAESLLRKAEPAYQEKMSRQNADYLSLPLGWANLHYLKGEWEATVEAAADANRLQRKAIQSVSRYLAEAELAAYIRKFSQKQDHLYTLARDTAFQGSTMPALCFDNVLFYKGFLLNEVQRIRNFAIQDTATRKTFSLLTASHRRLAGEYAKPLARQGDVAALEARASELEKELVRQVAGLAEALKEAEWREVQSRLQLDEAAVEFVRFQHYLHHPADSFFYAALLLRPGWDSPRWVNLCEEGQLNALLAPAEASRTDQFNALYHPGWGGLETAGPGLYELLWAPLEAFLPGVKTVYFAPEGTLHRLNLNAVMTKEGSMLGDQYRLIRLNSTRQLASPVQRPAFSHEACLMGGIRYEMDSIALAPALTGRLAGEGITLRGELSFGALSSDGWPYLPGTANELQSLDKILQKVGFEVKTLQDYEASEEAFQMIGKPRILHIATHGYFFPDPEKPAEETLSANEQELPFKWSDHPLIRSGLILAGGNHAWQGNPPLEGFEDGILTAYEISRMDLSGTELVVLSACETGLGDIAANEGVYGLQRAFRIAGARHLLLSLWKVPDRQTTQLMEAFYKNWLEGKMPLRDAINDAQRQLREEGWPPYYWAGFVLME